MSGTVPHTAKSSDQMPEEAPAAQVPDDRSDTPEGAARESGRRHARNARPQPRREDAARRSGEDRAQRQATNERPLDEQP